MASKLQWCLATLLFLGVAGATTPEPPLILNENTTPEPPLILFEDQENSFENTNPTHVDGEELFESDIRLTREQRKLLAERKATVSLCSRWPTDPQGYPTVPFVFNDTLVDQKAVLAGISHWENHTCIRFKIADNLTSPHLKFIKGSGCWSSVGISSWTGQSVSIGSGCNSLGVVVHEIGHALGFYHEQSRSDRDNYVHINFANIKSGYEKNFDKYNDNNYSVPYDYTSVMHYGTWFFSTSAHATIATVDPLAQTIIGKLSGLSHRDKLLANRMYPCIVKWLNDCGSKNETCLNDGYTGADCKCVCPQGTSGEHCEIKTGGYYDGLLSSCSENITTARNITSPNYPSNYPAGQRCVKWIRAPSSCYRVQLKFHSFQMSQQTASCNGTLCCYSEYLEIRTNDPYDGELYCGTMINRGQVFTSSGDQMILHLTTKYKGYQGFSAEVSFVPSPLCQLLPVTASSRNSSGSN